MAVVFAIGSAMVVGTSDFLGGFASRHVKATIAAAWANAVGALFFVVAAPIVGGSLTSTDLTWSLVSGVGGALGIMSLYRGISASRVSIVSPMAGVGAATIPVLYTTIRGEDLAAGAVVGIILGILAIAMVSTATSRAEGSIAAAVGFGAAAGAGLGFMLMALGQTGDDAGLWPLLPSRLAGVLVLTIIVVSSGDRVRLPRAARPTAAGAGLLAASGNALFLAGTQVGSLALVAVITSMFPAVTVIWARSIFGERLNRVQVAGLGLALVSIALIAAG